MQSASEKLARARTGLVLDHPFFGSLALRLTPVESSRTESMATDGRSLFYNAKYVEALPDAHLLGMYAHEVMHPAMQHHTRREHRDPDMWNEAADFAINQMLIESGFQLWDGALVDKAYSGLGAEQIFDKLSNRPEPPPADDKQDDKQEEDDKQDEGDEEGAGDEGEGEVDQDGEGKPSPGDQPGAVFDAPEQAVDEAEWQVAVKQAIQVAQMMGTLPGGLQQLVEKANAPKVDWKSILRRFVQQSAAADYSWKLPNRRYLAQGLYLPELRSESMPPMVVFLDTSGSTQPFMAAFLAELNAVADECKPESIYLVHVDSAVHKVEKFERGEPLGTVVPMGLGGTSFIPAFEWAETEQIEPGCAIYLTDGEGVYPAVAPSYPVLWCLSNPYPTPWGENVVIN